MLDRILDYLKSDQQLMEEETALFAQIMEADEHEEATGVYIPVPKHVFDSQVHKLKILADRGHVTDGNGGWSS